MFYLNFFQNRSKRLEKVHVVIGPKSCDLDSLISTFTYAYFLDKVRGKKGNTSYILNYYVTFKNKHFLKTKEPINLIFDVLIYCCRA